MTFKVGDVVCLKSGGPRMTVTGFVVGEPNWVWCHWFGTSNVKQHDSFNADTLDILSAANPAIQQSPIEAAVAAANAALEASTVDYVKVARDARKVAYSEDDIPF